LKSEKGTAAGLQPERHAWHKFLQHPIEGLPCYFSIG
jgi:hypothetical protein